MKVFILLAVVAGAFAFLDDDCPSANQHYEECGTACPLTCENHENPPKFCIRMCNPGCHCDKGYVKTKEGSCVLPEQCPSNVNEIDNCGVNQRLTTCGTACPLTCDNYNNPPKICTLQCVIGCECEDGYVKTADGRCVLPENCPNRANEIDVCGENERFTVCGTACPLTCDNYNNPPKFCTKQCVIGCQCQEGYVKAADGKCVRPENCPNSANEIDVCGENERFTSCGTACPLTCDNYQNPPKFCTLQCVIGCQCEKGFVESSDGICVRPENCPGQAQEKNCLDKPETGACMAYFPSFYYDAQSGTCKKFIYGGCQGNGNRYRTKEECLQNCAGVQPEEASAELCSLEPETGMCRGYFPRFHFDRTTGQCKRFIYGGCGGNKNNFGSEEECQSQCGNSAPQICGVNEVFTTCGTACPLTCDNLQDQPKACTLQCVIGCQCRKGYVRDSEGDCVLPQNCASQTLQQALDRPDCDKAPEVGVCRARMPRFYYDQQEGMCKQFIYGGCGGNRNNFATEFDCYNKCGALATPVKACLQEKTVGPCKAYFKRFFFNSTTGKCEEFVYGGCGGNSNNFLAQDDCEAVCLAETE